MQLIRISGHSCAGKSRLLKALVSRGLTVKQPVLYTSRRPRALERHGVDYFFHSESLIRALPAKDFLIGPVRSMLQAVDLSDLQTQLLAADCVILEIWHLFWPQLLGRLAERPELGGLKSTSVFLTAVDPSSLEEMADEGRKVEFIEKAVERMLIGRGADSREDCRERAKSAPREILDALKGAYDRVILSAPEGPDGEDAWTAGPGGGPMGQARKAVEEFIEHLRSLGIANAGS